MSVPITNKFSQVDSKHILSHYDPAVLEMHKALSIAKEKGAPDEVVQSINYALTLVEKREDYCDYVSSKESEACANIIKETYKAPWAELKEQGKTQWLLRPGMLSGPLEGQFLKSLVSMHKAKRVLEVGMYTGYGAMAMAEALQADGELVTVDIDPYLETFTRDLYKQSPHGAKIKVVIGPAIDYMKQAIADGAKFDVIFLDADKSEYVEYLKLAFQGGLLAPGGTVLIDNALMRGMPYAPDKMEKIEADKNFTLKTGQFIAGDESLHCSLVPIRDGVAMVRRVGDVEGTCVE